MVLVITIIMITVHTIPTTAAIMAVLLLLSPDSAVVHDNTTCKCNIQAAMMTK